MFSFIRVPLAVVFLHSNETLTKKMASCSDWREKHHTTPTFRETQESEQTEMGMGESSKGKPQQAASMLCWVTGSIA